MAPWLVFTCGSGLIIGLAAHGWRFHTLNTNVYTAAHDALASTLVDPDEEEAHRGHTHDFAEIMASVRQTRNVLWCVYPSLIALTLGWMWWMLW